MHWFLLGVHLIHILWQIRALTCNLRFTLALRYHYASLNFVFHAVIYKSSPSNTTFCVTNKYFSVLPPFPAKLTEPVKSKSWSCNFGALRIYLLHAENDVRRKCMSFLLHGTKLQNNLTLYAFFKKLDKKENAP